MLHSIAGQSYANWKLILIDDCSSDEEQERERMIIKSFQTLLIDENESHEKIKVVWNSINRGKQWEVSNVLHGIKQCNEDDIICRIDADDWLSELDALAMINHYYVKDNCDCLWTAHRWAYSDKNISAAMPNNANPYAYPWVSSHLKTFRKSLITNVNDENFRDEKGDYIQRAGDQAIYLPVLHNARKRMFVPRVMYHYTIKDEPETYQTDDAKFQRSEAEFLRQRGYVE
jgi:glycosyltransferase involved in cell wall biosynthesis